MKQTLEALRAITIASTKKEILAALQAIGQKPSELLAKDLAEENKKKGVRIFLLLIASLLILVVTTLAYIGGGYIAEYAGPIAIIFGVLDITIVILLFTDAIKGKMRFIAVAFEIVSLAYLGYAMGGYFGGGNLRTATEKKLVASYEVSKVHYTAAQSTADLFTRAVSNAKSVADVEA